MAGWSSGRYAGRGFLVAGLLALFDQLSKTWVVHQFWPARGCDPFDYTNLYNCRAEILPFVDFAMVWNRGISYGLFASDGGFGRYLLITLSIAAVVGFSIWLLRSGSVWLSASLGLIIGGAVGNVIDRVLYGAVADFVSLHGFGFYWYVFNLADAAIVAGAIGLLYQMFMAPTKSP